MQTQVLGGEWAIFGDGILDPCCDVIENEFDLGTHMFLTIDLTDIRSLTLEQSFIDGPGAGPWLVHTLTIIENVFLLTADRFEKQSPGNPSLWTIDVSSQVGTREVIIAWGHNIADDPALIAAFIDNITFHPVPEPSTLALIALGLAGLAVGRWRIR